MAGDDELDEFLRSPEFRKSFESIYHGHGPMGEEDRAEQEEWIAVRHRFEAMSTPALRRYVVKGVARTHRDIAKAILRERIEQRDTRVKIGASIAIAIGGAGALAQALVQLLD